MLGGMAPESIGSPALWAAFIAFVLGRRALDTGRFHKASHEA